MTIPNASHYVPGDLTGGHGIRSCANRWRKEEVDEGETEDREHTTHDETLTDGPKSVPSLQVYLYPTCLRGGCGVIRRLILNLRSLRRNLRAPAMARNSDLG